MARRGHEVAGHGYCHEDFSTLNESQQDELLERSELILEGITGSRPRGWRAPGGLMSNETRPLLAARGYLYDSSFCDDILPYWAESNSARSGIVELPTFEACSDRHYYQRYRPVDAVLRAWSDELAAISAVGGLFGLALSARNDHGSARGSRLRIVEEFLSQAMSQPAIKVRTCEQLAEHLLSHRRLDEPTYPA